MHHTFWNTSPQMQFPEWCLSAIILDFYHHNSISSPISHHPIIPQVFKTETWILITFGQIPASYIFFLKHFKALSPSPCWAHLVLKALLETTFWTGSRSNASFAFFKMLPQAFELWANVRESWDSPSCSIRLKQSRTFPQSHVAYFLIYIFLRITPQIRTKSALKTSWAASCISLE